MKYQRIIDAVYKTPLAISLAGFETIDSILRPIVRGERPTTDFFGNPMDVKMEIDNGTAIIPILGPLLNHASLIEKQCGATSYDDVREELTEAADRGVKNVVLNFDSPGGQVQGCLELADFIAEFQAGNDIPVYAFTDAQCCSAAYFLASSCEEIFASRTSMIGSIGCIIGFLDTSKAYEEQGLKPVIFTSGKFKGAGVDGTTLTDEQSEYIQRLVDTAFEQFAGHVTAHRAGVDMESMQGQVFYGSDAVKNGVADAGCDTLDEVIEFLSP